MIERVLLAAATALLVSTLAGCGEHTAKSKAAPGTALIKPWGYPLEALDRSVKPGDDFYRYANGGWLDRTEVPPDRPGVGFSTEMSDRNEERIASIIESMAGARAQEGSPEQMIRDLYASFMDEAQIEKLDLEPLKDQLERIAALSEHREVARLMADPALALKGPFSAYVRADAKEPTRYALYLSHSGLHLPDKSYYEREDERTLSTRKAFVQHVQKMLELAGIPEAATKARAIMKLQTRIAAHHWDIAARRDAERTYNAMNLDELEAYAPGFPWREYLAARGFEAAKSVIVQEKDAFPKLAALFENTPVETWRDYLTFSLLSSHAEYLSKRFEQEDFAFFGQQLSGQSEQRSREKRGIALVNGALDQAVGKLYVERYFSAESKRQITEMFENMRTVLAARIERLEWMTPTTKRAALEKLSKMRAKIGYPERWREYNGLEIRADDLIGNVQRARAEHIAYDAKRLGRPVDRSEWFVGPQIVNAFYDPDGNEVFVPAGYLQPPLFDPNADPAINYGAIGSIIGHEIGHGFDDQGSKSDGDGRLHEWWTPEDRAAFEALGARLADQFDKYEYLPGLFVNGRATLGENIGDLAGVVLAYHAYMLFLDGKPAPTLDGFTGPQRVFLGRAQARRFKRTLEFERMGLMAGVHSPMSLRVNGIVRNVDEWYEAFDVKPGDKLYLPPEERVRIW